MPEAKEYIASAIVRAQAELEEALSKLEKMPDFDANSVAFTAHALNNYLTVSGVAIELIMIRLADHPDLQIKTWLEGLQHATDLMVRSVSHLMFKSEIPETKFRFEKVDLPILVQRSCSFYQRIADQKTIKVNTDSDIDVPPVWTDRVAIAAVLDNLLSNAVKYSQPNKQIWVQIRGEKDWIVCRVQDEGPGLSPEDQEKLFQRGIKLTPRPSGDEGSTGYGLAVAKELIDKLGGKIWCETRLGEGACFAFRLPSQKESVLEPISNSTDQEQ